MMRRGFASLLMGLSLLVASTGWAGLVLSNSVLDEDQSRHLATRLMDHEGVRNVLVNRLGDGMERYVPADEPMSRQELRTTAAAALADPLAADALGDGISEAHRQGLVGADETTDDAAAATLDAGRPFSDFDVNEAVRLALIDARPSLEGRILANPLVKVQLPVEGLTWFSGLKALADRFAMLALAMAVIGFATSFVVAEEPTSVLRRAAWWMLVSAGAWMAVGPLFAAMVRFTVPSSYIVFAVAIETVLVSMRNPAIVMASFGIGLLTMSYLVPAVGRRRGALLLERATSRPDRTGTSVPTTGTDLGETAISDPEMAPQSATPEAPDFERVANPAGVAAKESKHQPVRTGGVGSRMSATWKEGHGYLDDARVAPFFSTPRRET